MKSVTNGDFADRDPSFSPDGTRLCFLRAVTFRRTSMGGSTWDDSDVFSINLNGTREKRITRRQFHGANCPSYSLDGRKIVFSAIDHRQGPTDSSGEDIFIVDSDGPGEPRRLTGGNEASSFNSYPSFSPDGRRIVFVSNRVSRPSPYDYEVWLMNVDGTEPRQITRNQSRNSYPVFSPDGKRIIFCSDQGRNGCSELWRVDVDGSHLERIRKDIPTEAGR